MKYISVRQVTNNGLITLCNIGTEPDITDDELREGLLDFSKDIEKAFHNGEDTCIQFEGEFNGQFYSVTTYPKFGPILLFEEKY